MTYGLATLGAWLQLLVLVGLLGYFVLWRGRGH